MFLFQSTDPGPGVEKESQYQTGARRQRDRRQRPVKRSRLPCRNPRQARPRCATEGAEPEPPAPLWGTPCLWVLAGTKYLTLPARRPDIIIGLLKLSHTCDRLTGPKCWIMHPPVPVEILKHLYPGEWRADRANPQCTTILFQNTAFPHLFCSASISRNRTAPSHLIPGRLPLPPH